jgi:site-specific DNA-methyltransferase (adenine-specific)
MIPASWYDRRNYGMNGLTLLQRIPDKSVHYVIFDPQYDHLLQRMKYGNKDRMTSRHALPQQNAADLNDFGFHIARILKPSGHVSVWMDTFILCETDPLDMFIDHHGETTMNRVDLIVWDKVKMGMGARSRHQAEYLMTFQKDPKAAKGFWRSHSIRDVHSERVSKTHPHSKPIGLQTQLIAALTRKGEVVVDPTAGGFSTMEAAHSIGRRFLGCELLPRSSKLLKP